MTLASALAAGRRAAEAMMLDACTIGRRTGAVDPLTGVAALVDVYAGRCRVQSAEVQADTPQSGGHAWAVQRYTVSVPVGACRPEVGDVVTVTAAAHDPHLLGRTYRVVALLHKSAATAYRLAVEGVVA